MKTFDKDESTADQGSRHRLLDSNEMYVQYVQFKSKNQTMEES